MPAMGKSFFSFTTCIQLPHIAAASRVSTTAVGMEKYWVTNNNSFYSAFQAICFQINPFQ